MIRHWAVGAMALAGVLAVTSPAGAAVTYDSNAIVNGDAESDVGSSDGFTIVSPTGWTSSALLTVVKYDVGGGFPTSGDPGPAQRGLNFFAGGEGASVSTATQSLDLSNIADDIDTGMVSFELHGDFGGFASQSDNAELAITFLDGLGQVLRPTQSIGGVTPADRGNATGFLPRGFGDVAPVGARTANLTLTLTRLAGSYNDGYADNLTLVFTAPPVPEPETWAMLLGGLGVMAVVARRRARS